MYWEIDLNNRPFNAILAGTKLIEGRTLASWDPVPYNKVKANDFITFKRISDGAVLKTKVIYVHHYKNTKEMLIKEGVKNVLSSGGTLGQGIKNYNSFLEYKEKIQKYGIYAIRIQLVSV